MPRTRAIGSAMRLLGHRGASRDLPENTLGAFLLAMEQGADGVELDVMRCGSGELVVCHDERLERVAGVGLEVARTGWRRLAKLDVGTPLGFGPARLSTLGEVLDALPVHAFVNLELKCDTLDDRGLTYAVGAAILDRGLSHRVLVSSFNPLCLVRLAQAYPQLRRGLLIDPDRRWAPQAWWWLAIVAPASVHPPHTECTAPRVNRWHSQGLEVVAWTVDDLEEARRLRALGVDTVITNRPGELRQLLGEKLSEGDG